MQTLPAESAIAVATPGWWVKQLTEVPVVPPDGPDDYDWFPLQHHFGLTTTGINAYRATAVGQELIGEHDEVGSGHEELYFVANGRARFVVAGEVHVASTGTIVVVRDPSVTRQASALEIETTILAIGGKPDPSFVSSWELHHFANVPRAD